MPQLSESTLLFPPQFLADTSYYAAMWAAKEVIVDTSMPFNKRFKSTHRTIIADANGLATLTVPIEKPRKMSEAKWTDINVSSHGAWWNVVMTALRSAYGRTPFCEFYIDDFETLINSSAASRPLMELCISLDRLMRRFMQVDTPVSYGNPTEILAEKDNRHKIIDCRYNKVENIHFVSYYQIRASRHGFIPNLSAVDLLFNIGPESPIILKKMSD